MATAYSDNEIAENLGAFDGVEDLGVELNAVGLFVIDLESGVGDGLGRGEESEASWELDDGVAVGHPHLALGRNADEERRAWCADCQESATVFACGTWLDLTAVGVNEILCAVADAENWDFGTDSRQIDSWCAVLTDGRGASRKDDAANRGVDFGAFVEGVYFAIYVLLSDAAADELRVLRAEVKYYYLLLHEILYI